MCDKAQHKPVRSRLIIPIHMSTKKHYRKNSIIIRTIFTIITPLKVGVRIIQVN